MDIRHDPDADAVYIRLREGPYAFGHALDLDRHIDFGSDERPIGVEFLGVSHGVNLANVPQSGEIAALLAQNGIQTATEGSRCHMGKKKMKFTVSSGNVYADLGIDTLETYDGHTIVFSRGPTSWGAYVDDLPVCVAVAETREECERLIREALALHVAALRGEKEQT